MNSRLYAGWVRHRREHPRPHVFAYRLFMPYLDLAELDEVFASRWLWSARAPALAWFRRSDHFGDPAQDLAGSVRDLVESRTNRRPQGTITLLTHLRYFGYCMNPVSFYYCWERGHSRLEAIVAEINNTPWGERHCYVLAADRDQFRFDKRFHVSPFMSMQQQYRWRLSTPGRTLSVHMQNYEGEKRVFNASLCLRSRPMSGRNMAWALARYPAMTAKVIAAIYWQALRLWAKGGRYHPHPKDLDPERAHP